MPHGPVLSAAEKTALKQLFETLCEELWLARGYKKTSVKTLCERAGVGISAFYGLYPTKEDLFVATLARINGRLYNLQRAIVAQTPTKAGFASAMGALFAEYNAKPALYNTNTEDYKSLESKLSQQQKQALCAENLAVFEELVQTAGLTLAVPVGQAYAVLIALLAMLYKKSRIQPLCPITGLFSFMANTMVQAMFE